jgi:hypothetical protein
MPYNGKLYELWQIAWYISVKPLRSLSGLKTLKYSTLPAITYTKC